MHHTLNPFIAVAQLVYLADSGSALPALHEASLQKRFGPVAGTAGSAAALTALPPQSPPDLHKMAQKLKTCVVVCAKESKPD